MFRAVLGEQPDQVPGLHRRASAWYEQNGEQPVATSHALAAGDFERAADLAELAIPAMRRIRQEAAVRAWVKVLPDALIRSWPVLSVAYAWARPVSGELDGVETRLNDAAARRTGKTSNRNLSRGADADLPAGSLAEQAGRS